MSNNKQAIPVVQDDILCLQEKWTGQPPDRRHTGLACLAEYRHCLCLPQQGRDLYGSLRTSGTQTREFVLAGIRRSEGKLHRVYLGTSEELTLEQIRTAVLTLAAQETVAGDEQAPPVPQGDGHLRSGGNPQHSHRLILTRFWRVEEEQFITEGEHPSSKHPVT